MPEYPRRVRKKELHDFSLESPGSVMSCGARASHLLFTIISIGWCSRPAGLPLCLGRVVHSRVGTLPYLTYHTYPPISPSLVFLPLAGQRKRAIPRHCPITSTPSLPWSTAFASSLHRHPPSPGPRPRYTCGVSLIRSGPESRLGPVHLMPQLPALSRACHAPLWVK